MSLATSVMVNPVLNGIPNKSMEVGAPSVLADISPLAHNIVPLPSVLS